MRKIKSERIHPSHLYVIVHEELLRGHSSQRSDEARRVLSEIKRRRQNTYANFDGPLSEIVSSRDIPLEITRVIEEGHVDKMETSIMVCGAYVETFCRAMVELFIAKGYTNVNMDMPACMHKKP